MLINPTVFIIQVVVYFYPSAGGSVDTELDRIHEGFDTPSSASKQRGMTGSKGRVFGSIERGIDRVLTALTPKKRTGMEAPRRVRVSTTDGMVVGGRGDEYGRLNRHERVSIACGRIWAEQGYRDRTLNGSPQ